MGKLGIVLSLTLALGGVASAQDYDGPPPPKSDVPYLLHATNLVETESGTARTEERKKETAHVVTGAASPVRTPLAEPIFIFQSDEISIRDLKLWEVESVNGTREIAFPNDAKRRARRGPRPVYTSVKKIDEDVYKLEVSKWLDNGEYCFSPDGSDKVFCFQVY